MRRVLVLVTALVVGACGGGASSVPSAAPSIAPPVGQPSMSPAATSSATPAPVPSAATLKLVALGDSIPFGSHFCNGCVGYPKLFGEQIEASTGLRVDAVNRSQDDGLTAARMVKELQGRPDVTADIRDADIITLSIGHNDTPWNALDDGCDGSNGFFDGNVKAPWAALIGPCLQVEVDRYRKNLDGIMKQVVELRGGKPTVYRYTNQYGDIPGDPCCPPEATNVSKVTKDAFNNAAASFPKRTDSPSSTSITRSTDPTAPVPPARCSRTITPIPRRRAVALIADLLAKAGLAPLR